MVRGSYFFELDPMGLLSMAIARSANVSNASDRPEPIVLPDDERCEIDKEDNERRKTAPMSDARIHTIAHLYLLSFGDGFVLVWTHGSIIACLYT